MGDYSGNHEDYTSACQTCEDERGKVENVSKAGLEVNAVLILLNLLFVQGFGTFFVVGEMASVMACVCSMMIYSRMYC